MSKVLGGDGTHADIDHNACICCGTMNIAEPQEQDSQSHEDEKESSGVERDSNEDVVH